jgi:hypothetical protein
MRRGYRTGAAVAAAATLMTGAGYAALRDPATPASAEVVSAPPSTAGPDDLDASLAALRNEVADLTKKIADRPATTVTQATRPPATDATTGASGAGDDEHEEGGDDD